MNFSERSRNSAVSISITPRIASRMIRFPATTMAPAQRPRPILLRNPRELNSSDRTRQAGEIMPDIFEARDKTLKMLIADDYPPLYDCLPRQRGKQSTRAPTRSAGVVGTARRKGGSGNRGRPVTGEGSGLNGATGGGHGGRRTGSYDRRSRVMPAEERALTSGALSKMARSW